MCACQARLPEASKAKPGRACFASVVRRGAGCAGDGAAARCTLHAARRKLGGGGGVRGRMCGRPRVGSAFRRVSCLARRQILAVFVFRRGGGPAPVSGLGPWACCGGPIGHNADCARNGAAASPQSAPGGRQRSRPRWGALRRLLYPPDARHSFLTRAAVVRLTNVIARVRLACCVTTQALCGAVEAHGDGCEQPSEAGRRSRRRSQSSPRLLLNILVHPSSTCLQWTQGRAR